MKALSIRQPWAWLIVMGYKDVENRTWPTRFRGKFLVHAGKEFDHDGYRVASEMGLPLPEPHEFARGGIVGVAEITDCVTQHDSTWFSGPYGFVLKNAYLLPLIPLRGKLRFFTAPVKEVGRVIQYDASRHAAEVELTGTLSVGDPIHIGGPRSDWGQSVKSLQVDHQPVAQAWAGQIVWSEVEKRAYKGDLVYVIEEEEGEEEEEEERRLELEITPKGLVPESGPEPEPRWLQGQLYEIIEGKEIRLDRALRADALHRLVVRIGAADEEWITAPEDAAFPIEELPEDQEGYELRIVFSEPHHVPQPLADTIYLPRLRGNSTTCEFQFRTRRDVGVFEGRVAVMHGNRILQTMFLVAQVLPEPVHAPSDAAIELKPETAVRAHLVGLDAREPFDVALVADTGSDGMMHVAGFTSERVELRSLENVEQPIKRMRRRLSQIASSPEDFRDLNADATQDLLRFLARQGSLLYDGIVRTQIGGSGLLNDTDRRIQLVSARESFLPLEFMYDHPSPLPEAGLCPRAGEALQTGRCTHCDQLDDEAIRAYVCPLGFWCMSRVIERHAIKPVAETNLSGTEYALQSDPVTGRETLDVLNAAVYAASNRVKETQIEELLETLADVTGHRVEHVPDWDTWRTAVQSRNPSILVLLPHTLEDADYVPALEIGEEQQLPEDQITASYVHTARDYHPPVVLLLGCETAEPDVPFQAFAVQFRIHGAAIVLSTLTPVLGRHAVPVAQMLLGELKRAARARGAFGDALLELRRRALAAGIPMVLSLVAYGDADWRLHSDTTAGVPVDEP